MFLDHLVSNLVISAKSIFELFKGAKTPFRRRLDKTFGLIKEWKAKNLDAHPHASIKLADKDNQARIYLKIRKYEEN